ncbi:hypothetical protein [Micromonospora sp. NPDC093277]|uniref:hypothetical protein n=1 Tax=Micromonospora sp. NPDC093277 TaxID=3364291 RepID=UPI0037F2E3B3
MEGVQEAEQFVGADVASVAAGGGEGQPTRLGKGLRQCRVVGHIPSMISYRKGGDALAR